jgi:putative iron-only hydrogenase system regulator
MNNLFIMGILIDKREKSAPNVQEILTQYGDSIVSRFGVHDPGEEEHGLITLTVSDNQERVEALSQKLEHLDGVTSKWVQMK